MPLETVFTGTAGPIVIVMLIGFVLIVVPLIAVVVFVIDIGGVYTAGIIAMPLWLCFMFILCIKHHQR